MSLPDDPALQALAAQLGEAALARGWMLVTAESCTGGWVSQVLTAVAGSSSWFDRGFVTYSNAAKVELLGVSAADLQTHGAVSETVVAQMAGGALAHSAARAALAVSGIAGPGGGSADKPVGTVCFGWATDGAVASSETCHFVGDRAAIRRQAVAHALGGLLRRLQTHD